jgi:hypothetical protein
VDVEGLAGLEHAVGRLERGRERVHVGVRPVGGGVQVREVEHGADPGDARRQLDDVVERAEVADASHHLDAERHEAALRLQPLAEEPELLDHGVERLLPLAPEQETGVEDDDLGAARRREPRRVVEHAHRHAVLLAEVEMAHEAGERGMDRERDVVHSRRLSEPGHERVVELEAADEADLAGVVARRGDLGDRRLRVDVGAQAGGAEANASHSAADVNGRPAG